MKRCLAILLSLLLLTACAAGGQAPAPEDLIDYMAPRYTAPGNNPNT